jgi:asparagine synthase (glutamine-hydrolysing)
MPGVVGIVSENVVDEQLLDRMVNSLKHEDFFRVDKYISSNFGIARVHLGIFNPEPQPIFNEDKSLCIFMDGKIYDYGEQLNELKNKGHKFNTENDPEFCLHSYEEYGKDFIKRLNGSFVLLICDLKSGEVIIANDRYGFRVHYYAINNGKLLFAPEAKAILQDETFRKELNDEAVAEFFAFGEFWGDKTFFKGIKVLTPASILTYDGRDLSIEKYWKFKYKPDYNKSESEFVDELVKTFKKAVEIRTEDNFRYGVGLSGGLDSRSVLAGVDPTKRKDVIAYTFGPMDCDEVKIAKRVTKRAGIKEHSVQEISPELIIDNAEYLVWLTDGRNYIGVSFGYPVLKLLKDKIDVIFDGFALDLTLGGSYLSKDKVDSKNEDLLFNILSKKRLFQEKELHKLFTSNYYNKVKEVPTKSFKREFNKIKADHPGNKSDQFSLSTHVACIPIGYATLRSMMEMSPPPADNDFIDAILTIPPEWRLNHYIYRKFLKKLSPELAKISYNKTMIRADAPLLFWKVGSTYLGYKELIKKRIHKFSKGKILLPNKRSYVNFDEWFRTNENWQAFFRELLLNENGKSEKYFNQDYIEKFLQEQITGEKDNSAKLLYLASFKIFLRLFF